MRTLHILAIAVGLMVGATLGYAQDSPDRSADRQAIKDALVKKIEQVKYEKIKTSLGLDDASAQKFFATYKPAEKDIQSLVKQRNDELKKLADLTNAGNNTDVDQEMQNIRDLNQKIAGREQQLDSDLKPILSPQQRAKLLMFERDFNQRVRQQLAKHGNGPMKELRHKMIERHVKNKLMKIKNKDKGGNPEHP